MYYSINKFKKIIIFINKYVKNLIQIGKTWKSKIIQNSKVQKIYILIRIIACKRFVIKNLFFYFTCKNNNLISSFVSLILTLINIKIILKGFLAL